MATVAQNETDPVNRSFTGILEEGNFYDREDDACHIKNGDPVPYRIERPDTEPQKPLGKGARAKVVKVCIARRRFKFLVASAGSQTTCLYDEEQPLYCALKVFKKDSYLRHETKIQMILRLHPHRNIMAALCSFRKDDQSGPPTYCMLFPLAKRSLQEHLSQPGNRPESAAGRLGNIAQMLGVAEGIEWLTERIDDRGKYQGRITIFHNDLKPANILVCEDLLHTGSRAIFKISDFGEAIVRIMDSGNPPAKDEISPAEFSAPEVSFDHQNLTPSSDVWSFACILFLVLSFNIIGQWTLKGSADERRAENPLAQFFSGGSRRGLKNFLSNKKLKVNQHVESSMKRLEATGKNKSDARVTLGLVAMLRERLFVINPEDRLPISKVVNEMRQVYGSRRFITPEITDRKFRIGDSVDTCAQSPDGRFEFFCRAGGNALSTFSCETLEPLHRPLEKIKSQNKVSLSSEACSEKSLCHVISNRRDPELRILPKSMYGEQEKNGLSLSLKDCEVMKIAMSPDANHLAVVAKLARGKTVLRVYDIQDIEAQNENSHEVESCATLPPAIGEIYTELRTYGNDWAGILRFSRRRQYLCHAVESQVGKTLYCNVYIWTIEDIRRSGKPCRQKELKAESVERYYQFLTCLAPLNERIGFIAIHSEERVLRYDPEKRYESDVEDWRQKGLKTVLITDDDKWVIFVGVYNKRLTVSAANLDSTIVSCKKLQIEDAAAIGFEPPADKVCIFENDQGERHLLFTYSGKMCRSVRLNIESLLEER